MNKKQDDGCCPQKDCNATVETSLECKATAALNAQVEQELKEEDKPKPGLFQFFDKGSQLEKKKEERDKMHNRLEQLK